MKSLRDMTRSELYELVWAAPIVTLGPKYGVSDVAVAKRCKGLGVPTPRHGYWAKVEAGKKVKKLPLPTELPQHPEMPHVPQRVEDMVYYSLDGNFVLRNPHPVTVVTQTVSRSRQDGGPI